MKWHCSKSFSSDEGKTHCLKYQKEADALRVTSSKDEVQLLDGISGES